MFTTLGPERTDMVDARVVRTGDTYYLQFRTPPQEWVYACGYHRGAPGFYHYQFCTAGNPYYHVEHTLPEVLEEMEHPTIPERLVRLAASNSPRLPSRIDEIFDVQCLRAALTAHPKDDVTTPYPPADAARQLMAQQSSTTNTARF